MNITDYSVGMFIDACNEMSEQTKLYIFCAGTYGNVVGEFLSQQKISWEGYVDNNEQLHQEILNGKNIYSLTNIECSKEKYFIIATIFYENILQQLLDYGVNSENILYTSTTALFDEIACINVNPIPYTEKIKAFRQVHNSKRCFIIGNGPSLKLDDLNKLKNEYTMAANKIYQLYPKTDWRPTYYFTDDPYVIKTSFPTKKAFQDVAQQSKASFTSTRRKMFAFRDDEDMQDVFFYRAANNLQEGMPEFTRDCSQCVYTSYTITYTMLQFAVYMGFDTIYLLGIDHNYSMEKNIHGEIICNANVKNHAEFMDDNNFDIEHIPEIGIMNLGYIVASEYAQRHNINIYNATRGGKLEVFERANLDDIVTS